MHQVVPYTECGEGWEAQRFNETHLEPKLLVEKVCSQREKVTKFT